MIHTNEPGTQPRPGVLLGGEPGEYSANALRLQTLTRRGLSARFAEILSPYVWEAR
jgi:hypothetical protein